MLIFSGSIGFDVFKHICSKEGVTISLFDKADAHCPSEVHDVPSCCKKEKEEEKGCCTDEEEIVQLKFDYFQKVKNWSFKSIPLEKKSPAIINIALITEEEKAIEKYWLPPPPLPQSTKRALIQVYTI